MPEGIEVDVMVSVVLVEEKATGSMLIVNDFVNGIRNGKIIKISLEA